jgi:hypothetical protein
MSNVKIAICCPAYGDTKAKFTQSLANMLIHFMSANITDHDGNQIEREVEMIMVACSMLTESRHKLVAEALFWEADYMLWLDADHVFPPDTLARLWAHNKPVVGCNYARRCTPTAPTAAKTVSEDDDHKNLVYTTIEKASAGDLEQVDHLGFGVCLMDMRIFDALETRAEEKGENSFLPLFRFETAENGIGVIGEDVFFFKKLKDAGIPVYCDHALSWEVGHIHERLMMNSHAVVQEAQWTEGRSKARQRMLDRADDIERSAA